MFRRRMMLESHKNDDIDWDLEWDYTMGLPEDNGFKKTINGTNISDELTVNGLLISVNSNGYIRYRPIGFETCNEGIYEIKLIISRIPTSNGVRLILSNGTNGNQIFIHSNQIKYDQRGAQIKIDNVIFDTELTIKIERINNQNYVYVNNEIIYQSKIVSIWYTGGNDLFFQTNPLKAVLKSIKLKKIS